MLVDVTSEMKPNYVPGLGNVDHGAQPGHTSAKQ